MLIICQEPAEQYLLKFHWNKVKYRADKPLGEIIDTLQKVALSSAFNAAQNILIARTGSH